MGYEVASCDMVRSARGELKIGTQHHPELAIVACLAFGAPKQMQN